MNRWLSKLIITIIFLTLAAAPAAAGGWATVRLEDEPGQVVAGEPWQFGFLVKQHDRTPTNEVEPVVRAVHMETGEIVTAEAVQLGAVGHFESVVTFPVAGDWKWEIAPEPFGPTTMETLSVVDVNHRGASGGPGLEAAGTFGAWRISLTVEVGLAADDVVRITPAAAPVEVVITDHGFTPSRLEIAVGTEVVWINQSATAHDVGSEHLRFRDSGLLDAGAEFRQVFTEAGAYEYRCGPHPFMTGTIVVVE